MFEIGTRVEGTQTFKTYDPRISIDMAPGVTYQAIFNADINRSGWEEDTYLRLVETCEANGCELTYFGVCYPNNRIVMQWKMSGSPGGTGGSFQPAIFPAIPAAVLVLAALSVIGAGIGSVSFFKFSEIYENNPLGVGVVVAGVVLVGVLLAAGYVMQTK